MKSGVTLIKAAAYCRISTLIHGQDINNQVAPIKDVAAARGFEIVKVYTDEGISGATSKRRGLDAMMADARRGRFKTVIIMEVSRLARDVRHLLNVLHELESLGVSLLSVRESLDFSTPLGRAMVSLIAILVQVERDLLRERIKTALQVKKQIALQTGNGWTCGRPTKITPDIAEKIVRLRLDGLSVRQIAKQLEVAKSGVHRILSQNKLTDQKE